MITSRQKVAQSRLFGIEQINLTFSNGEQREYERMTGTGRGAVMVVPMLDNDTLLLIREYCAGTHSYLLGFPKGLLESPTNNCVYRHNIHESTIACRYLTLVQP